MPREQVPQGRRDIRLLYAARAARAFGDGFAVILLPVYLSEIGFSPVQIGIMAAVALLGSAALTLAVGWLAVAHDLRNLLVAGAGVMAATGLALPNAEHIVPLLVVMFVGTINPSTGDIGMLVPLEQAMLAHGAADRDRTRTFAHYSLIGSLATAAGALAAAVPDILLTAGIERAAGVRLMFYAYAALGVAAVGLYWVLPHTQPAQAQPPRVAPLGPSRTIVYKLAALFSLDSFAGGFAVPSLIALWLFERFDLSLATTALFFFWSNVLTAFSYPVAARLARRFGLINTMVFTHIPSSLCLIAAALLPNLTAVLGLLLVRSALSQMDVPTRTSYVMAVVTPAERPAAASVTAVPRGLASAISPMFAGALLATPLAALPLILCGVLKIAYDLSLLAMFRHTKPPEERGSGQASPASEPAQ
jgi:MFS family permease